MTTPAGRPDPPETPRPPLGTAPAATLSARRRRAAVGVTPGQLRTLVAVADAGSVRGAADALHVTESAVSATLAALQRQIGVRLVTRQGRGIRVTAAGLRYVGYARRILGLLEEAALAAVAESDPERGWLRIAAVVTAGELLLPRLLADFRSRHPTVGVELEVAPRDRVWAMLRDRHVDLGVAGRPPDPLGLRTVALRPNTLVVVAAPGLAADVEAARQAPWLLREPGSGTRENLEELLSAIDATGPRLTLGSNGAVVEGAVAGLGLALVSREAVTDLLAAGKLVEVAIPGTPLERPYHLVGHPDLPATATIFAEHALASGEWTAPA